MFTLAALQVLPGIAFLLFDPRQRLERLFAVTPPSGETGQLPPNFVELMVDVMMVLIPITMSVTVALMIFFVLMVRRGRQWARIVMTIRVSFTILSTVYSVVSGGSFSAMPALYGQAVAFGILLGIVNFAINIAALVLLWRPETRAWFRAVFRRPAHLPKPRRSGFQPSCPRRIALIPTNFVGDGSSALQYRLMWPGFRLRNAGLT